MNTVQKLIAYASWYDGRKEKKGNSGFENEAFEKEMKTTGWYLGAAWCMFFVILIWKKVFKEDKEAYASILKTFNGSAKQTADRVKKEGYWETGDEPEPGAICIWLLGNGPSGHAAIVKSKDLKTNTMYNVEGNTNGAGSREGEVVNANKARTIKRPFQAKGLNVYLYIYPRKIKN